MEKKRTFKSYAKKASSLLLWCFAFLTNAAPLLVAGWLLNEHAGLFKQVFFALIIGFGATIITAAGSAKSSERFERVQPLADQGAWILMGIVLLINAIDLTTDTLQRRVETIGGSSAAALNHAMHGIRGLTDAHFCFQFLPDHQFTTFDVLSLVAGAFSVLLPWMLASADERVKGSRVGPRTILGLISLIFVLIELIVVFILHTIDGSAAGSQGACSIPDSLSLSGLHSNKHELFLAVSGIVLYLIGYLFNFKGLFDLVLVGASAVTARFSGSRRKSAADHRKQSDATWSESDKSMWLRTLRSLIFEAVILPPIIVAAALLCEQFNTGTAAVFGIFVYSGFSVWNLAAKTVSAPPPRYRRLGGFAVAWQFLYSGLLTVLWFFFFLEIGRLTGVHADVAASPFAPFFKPVLQFSIAAILVQVVFGTVYQHAWGRSLSDRWFLEGPEFALVATIVVLSLGAMPEIGPRNDLKLIVIAVLVLLMMFAPAIVLSRSLTAYVLIRVLPGKTAEVRKALMAEDVESAAVYGEYDIVAKIEVPGGLSALRGANDADNLMELASIVKRVTRRTGSGVSNTETLVDFSDFVVMRRSDAPGKKKNEQTAADARTES